MKATLPLPEFAARQARALLTNLVRQIERTLDKPDADAIHDLRVAVRRFSQCLDVFQDLFPRGSARRVRRRVNRLRKSAGMARDCDIALEYLAKDRVPDSRSFARELRDVRKQAYRELLAVLERVRRKQSWQKWRSRLGIGDAL
ncbi:MAG: CHAD domain-containing protein [Bryobacteraceae bacterium]